MNQLCVALAGVYAIVNCRNGKRYVGSTIDLARRATVHFSDLRAGRHANRYLQASFNKYGAGAFRFIVLEEVADRSRLRVIEQKWMDSLRACDRSVGYNIVPDSQHKLLAPETRALLGASRRGKKLSEQHRRNISIGNSGKPKTPVHRERLRIANLGKRHSDETKAKISAAWRPSSAETKRRISQSLQGHPVPEPTRQAIRLTKIGRSLPKRCVTTAAQRADIKRRIAGGEKIKPLAQEYGVSRPTIRNIVFGRFRYSDECDFRQ